MAGAMVRIGDQLILEEDYDETYIPSEQGSRCSASWELQEGTQACQTISRPIKEMGAGESMSQKGRKKWNFM